MKVSEIINAICREAEQKFGVLDNPNLNDSISVSIYPSDRDWQIGLQRPTTRQLDSGEIQLCDIHTIKQYEYRTGFFVIAPTLKEALKELHDRVMNAYEWEQ